jgi:hypothetical protein
VKRGCERPKITWVQVMKTDILNREVKKSMVLDRIEIGNPDRPIPDFI